MEIDRPVRYLKSVGPLMASRLEKLNIRTIKDLLYHLPFRYDDFTVKTRVSDVRVGETVTISGFIKEGKMEGALVGGASLDPTEFIRIVESVD